MHIPRPTVKNEINLSTLALAVGLCVTLGGLVYNTGRFTATVEKVQTEAATARADIKSSVSSLRADVENMKVLGGKYDNLSYRVTVQEQQQVTMSKSIEEMKRALADLGADTRVIREILTRLDKRGE